MPQPLPFPDVLPLIPYSVYTHSKTTSLLRRSSSRQRKLNSRNLLIKPQNRRLRPQRRNTLRVNLPHTLAPVSPLSSSKRT